MAPEQDDLFAPSLGGLRRGAPPTGKRPWPLLSQAVVAVLGGPIAAGLVGYENGRRLGLPSWRLAAIAGVALAALAGVRIAASVISSDGSELPVLMVGGGLSYLAIRQLQRDGDRRYRAGRNARASYDSLWPLGVGVVLVGIVLGALAMVGTT